MWGMRWTGSGEYAGYALIGLAAAALWLFWRTPGRLMRAEAKAGRVPKPPAGHPVRRGRKIPARIPGDDRMPGDDRLRQRSPLTDRERETFAALLNSLTEDNEQRGGQER